MMRLPSIHRPNRTFYLGIIFWIGFAALIYQVYSVRVLFMFFVEDTHAVALALSSFLAGLAFSSLLFPRLAKNREASLALVARMMLAAGLYGFLVLTHYAWIPQALDAIRRAIVLPWLVTVLKYLIVWVFLFLPAFFTGGTFALINGLTLDSLKLSARKTGDVYFWDTLGAIGGALLAGFVLLPHVGVQATCAVAASINLLVAAMLMRNRRDALATTLLLLLLIALSTCRYATTHEHGFHTTQSGMIVPAGDDPDHRFGKVLFQKESPFGRVTVSRNHGGKMLFVDYRAMCERTGAAETEMARLLLPFVPPGGEALSIGLGCGFTSAELAHFPHTRRLDLVEINPAVVDAAHYFGSENHELLDAPNLDLHIIDGAQWLRVSPRRYDVIAIDISQIAVIYSSPLFTRDVLQIARDRLKDHGVLGFWSLTVSADFTRVMLNTLRSVFPYVQSRSYDSGATVYYASMHPFTLPAGRLREKPGFAADVAGRADDQVNTLEDAVLQREYMRATHDMLPEDASRAY